MCCFSRAIVGVAETNLFARETANGRQMLVYQLELTAVDDQPLAMILPLPVPPRSSEAAIRFIDLSRYPTFFADLRKPFLPRESATRTGGAEAAAQLPAPRLIAHRVGSFEASFVPTLEDFARLDERFRLQPAAWHALPRYADWGFAVFKLRDAADAATR